MYSKTFTGQTAQPSRSRNSDRSVSFRFSCRTLFPVTCIPENSDPRLKSLQPEDQDRNPSACAARSTRQASKANNWSDAFAASLRLVWYSANFSAGLLANSRIRVSSASPDDISCNPSVAVISEGAGERSHSDSVFFPRFTPGVVPT